MGRKNKKYTHEEYERAMELLEKGYGLTETCKSLGWPKTKAPLLHYWKYGKHKPPETKWVAKPSNELAYVIGALNDGCVTKDEPRYQYRIIFEVIDEEFGEVFSKNISRVLCVGYHKPHWNENKKEWRVVYYSKAFVIWYKKTEKNGIKGFKPYIEYSRDTAKCFLRGIYDSEGCNHRCRKIFLSNNNVDLLQYTQHLLKKYFDITTAGPYLHRRAGSITKMNGKKIKTKHNNYQTVIGRKKYTLKFLEEIGFSITRKQLGLKKREPVKQGFFRPPFSDNQ